MKWHEDNSPLVSLAIWLNDECDYFEGVDEVIHYFEKPWKWDREYHLWQLWKQSREPELIEECIEACIDGQGTAESVRAWWEEQEELSPDEIAEIKGDLEYHRRKDEGEL